MTPESAFYSPDELASDLLGLLEEAQQDDNYVSDYQLLEVLRSVFSFKEAGLLTNDSGLQLVTRFGTFNLTIRKA